MDSQRATTVFADNGAVVYFVQKQPHLKILVPNPPLFVHVVIYGALASIDEHSLQVINTIINNMVRSGEIKDAFAKAGFVDVDHLGNMELKL